MEVTDTLETARASVPRGKRVLVAAGAALVIAAVAIWYSVAAHRLSKRVGAIEAGLAAIRLAGAGAIQEGRQAGSIAFDRLAAFAATFERARPALERDIEAIRGGEGMAFWLSGKRKEEAARLSAGVAAQAELAAAGRQALASAESLNREVAAVLSGVENDWAAATNGLSPDSDSAVFDREIASMARSVSRVQEENAAVRKQTAPRLGGTAEQFRQGILADFSERMRTAQAKADARRESLNLARQELRRYKTAVHALAGGNQSLLSALGRVSSALVPAANSSYEKTDDLRAFLREAEQPLGGEAGRMLSGFLGGRSNGPVTAITIASEIAPGTALVMTALRELCDGIERTHEAVNELAGTTERVLPPLRSFLASGSRGDLAALAAAAPQAASYFEGRRGLFDPVIENIEKIRPTLNQLAQRIAAVRLPPARSVLQRGVSSALQVIDGIESPFRDANGMLESAGASMREIESQEAGYVARLNELKSWTDSGHASADETPTGTAANIRDVDFRNFNYPTGNGDETVRVSNGKFERDNPEDRMSLEVVSVSVGDISGDGVEEAAVVTSMNTGGSGVFTEVLVYGVAGGSVSVIGKVEGGDRAKGGIRSAGVEGGFLVVDQSQGSEESGMCCPDFAELSRYRVSGGGLERRGEPVRRKLPVN